MKKMSFFVVNGIFSILVFLLAFQRTSFNQVIVHNLDKFTGATEVGFSDEAFYACVVDAAGKSKGTVLTDEELASIDDLICKNKGVTDITGIDKLTNLTSLNLMENNLNNVDLSNNTGLMYVELSGNPNITSIDLSKNVNLKEIYFRNNSLKSIDLSKNVNLENLDLGYNELVTVDLSKNINLKYLYLGSNKLTSIDLTNNVNLVEVTLSANKLSSLNVGSNTLLESLYASSNQLTSIDVAKNIVLINMDMSDNKISEINIANNTSIKKLVLSGNQLTSIDLTNNVNLKELYISSNNLTSLDIYKLSKLAHLNAVFNNFDNLAIIYPENIIDLAIEADWIGNYDFNKFANLKSLRIVDYYIIPVYGTKFEVSNLSKYKSNDIDYHDYILYTDFNNTGSSYVNSSNTINGSLGEKLEYRICSTNINGYHSSCGDDLPDNIEIIVDNNVEVEDLGTYSEIIYYDGYSEFRFMSLTSDKYVINENNSTIDVGGDSDDEIKANLNSSYSDAIISINGNSLKLSYNGEVIREFTLERVTEIPTGSLGVFIIIGVMIVAIIGVVIFRRNILDIKG